MKELLQKVVFFFGVFMIEVPLYIIGIACMFLNADLLALKIFTLALTVFKKICVFTECNDEILNEIDELMTKIKGIFS